MIYATNESGLRVTATPGAVASCPMCLSSLVPKCGKTVTWHWAHCSLKDCDEWAEGETPWHSAWKSRFSNSEVAITKDGKSHRADVVSSSGCVIEFQHSAISAGEIEQRERFYGDMVWVLDMERAYRSSRIGFIQEWPENGQPYCKFKWNHRKTSFDTAARPIFLDLGIASRDTDKGFFKESPWWDDGGLKDGIRRDKGWWVRTIVSPMLLEVKKRTDGCGWGRLVSLEDFCLRFGGEPASGANIAASGVRPRGLGEWLEFDGYVTWRIACRDSGIRDKLADMKQEGVIQ